jgi:hypothetical protein
MLVKRELDYSVSHHPGNSHARIRG